MESLRQPLFYLAAALIAVAVLVEIGAAGALRGATVSASGFASELPSDVADDLDGLDADQRQELARLRAQDKPPGLGIPYLALLDGLALFTVGLVGAALLIPERVHAKVQGLATLIVAVLVILAGLVMIFAAFGLVLLMVSLLLAVPFGTITYFAVYGFFDRAGAGVALSLLMLLKLGFAGSLVFAHQRFLQSTGLVLLVITSLVANVVVGFLHGIVPRFLVSITDGIAAIVVAILAVIWAIVFLIGAIRSLLRVLRLDRALKS